MRQDGDLRLLRSKWTKVKHVGMIASRLALAALAAISLIGASSSVAPPLRDGSGAIRPLPQPAVVLFWAIWCAPCRAELRDIDALRKAAAPLPVVVVAADASPRSKALLSGLADDAVRFPASASVDVLALVPEAGGALPTAVAFDKAGRRCAYQRGGVTAADLARWRADCSR
jgi:cytochrome c biogenesis protein CcmG/thiol:disulfide interchange protein DsbE